MTVEPDAIKSLKALRGAEQSCTRCPLYRNATQAVPGEGRARARIILVGEQPGDQEDKQGKPFVGPAGRVLAEALDRAGIARDDCFVTNAVKHFKFEQRGKRRLHKRPGAYEIALVRPELIVALGATAVRSVCGKPLAIGGIRAASCRSRVNGGCWPLCTRPSFCVFATMTTATTNFAISLPTSGTACVSWHRRSERSDGGCGAGTRAVPSRYY